MGMLAKAKTKKRTENVLIPISEQFDSSDGVPVELRDRISNGLTEVLVADSLSGVFSTTRRGRESALVGLIADAVEVGSGRGNSQFIVDYPGSELKWWIALGIPLNDGTIAVDWALRLSVITADSRDFLRVATPQMLMKDGALVNGNYYDSLKSAMVSYLSPICAGEPQHDGAAKFPYVTRSTYEGEWNLAWKAWVESWMV
jgi:hypothetical protein